MVEETWARMPLELCRCRPLVHTKTEAVKVVFLFFFSRNNLQFRNFSSNGTKLKTNRYSRSKYCTELKRISRALLLLHDYLDVPLEPRQLETLLLLCALEKQPLDLESSSGHSHDQVFVSVADGLEAVSEGLQHLPILGVLLPKSEQLAHGEVVVLTDLKNASYVAVKTSLTVHIQCIPYK